jgi:hypothetical protein
LLTWLLFPTATSAVGFFLCCSLGQNLAKLELQVVLATLLSRFKFKPGPALQREVDIAAKTGQPLITAVYALAEVHVTLQPAGGQMLLIAEPYAQ